MVEQLNDVEGKLGTKTVRRRRYLEGDHGVGKTPGKEVELV